jgi:hypothetical protein
VSLVAELFAVETLTDKAVLHLSTVGVAPFVVESILDLLLSTLRFGLLKMNFNHLEEFINLNFM